MLTIGSTRKIYVYRKPADMRCGIQRFSGIVREALGADPTDGSLFVFINRRRDRLKILHFDEGGFWLYYRVLEAGTFEMPAGPADQTAVEMDHTQLAMLLSGVSLAASLRRRKRFATGERAADTGMHGRSPRHVDAHPRRADQEHAAQGQPA